MRRPFTRIHEAGDTIVEVLLAIVVISVVIAGAYQATNRGLRIGQNAIERTQASEIASAQAEALRTVRDLKDTNANASAVWASIQGKLQSAVPSTSPCTGGGTPTDAAKAFWLNTQANPLSVTNGTQTTGYLKYWVEAYNPGGGYIDFYVNGCWQGIGETGIQNTGIVVRLTT